MFFIYLLLYMLLYFSYTSRRLRYDTIIIICLHNSFELEQINGKRLFPMSLFVCSFVRSFVCECQLQNLCLFVCVLCVLPIILIYILVWWVSIDDQDDDDDDQMKQLFTPLSNRSICILSEYILVHPTLAIFVAISNAKVW